jgi:hypothetical protein
MTCLSCGHAHCEAELRHEQKENYCRRHVGDIENMAYDCHLNKYKLWNFYTWGTLIRGHRVRMESLLALWFIVQNFVRVARKTTHNFVPNFSMYGYN